MGHRLADLDADELRRRYEAGTALEVLAAACGASRATVARRLRAAGCAIRPRGVRMHPKHPGAARLRELRAGQGLGVGRIAALLGVTRKTAARWLRRSG